MAPHTSRSRLLFAPTVGVFVLVLLSRARAQDLSDGWKKLDDQWNAPRRMLFRNMTRGETPVNPTDKQHVEAIDLAAKYDTYRVFVNHLEDHPGKINEAFKEFEGHVESITKAKDREQMQPLGDVFREKVRIHALEVIQYENAKPIHRIHNARILAKVAELGQAKLAETLITVLKDDKQNDAVHFYALRGLGILLAQVQPQPMPPLPVLTKDEQGKCAEAIVEFLNRKPSLSEGASKEEREGFHVLRREAVRALARIRLLAVNDKVRPALILARFAGEDERIQPPPRIDERLEAAIGLARMPSAQNNEYQADYAANAIGKFLNAFGAAANNEYGKTDAALRQRPWKIDAARMIEALAALRGDSGKNAYVAQITDRGTRVLQAIVEGKPADASDLNWFANPDNAPSSKELFKGAADTAVKPTGKSGESPEK
jgi:hypothetical protein